MEDIQPDLEWYKNISIQSNLPPRCQYAILKRCPRYYESFSLFGGAGISSFDIETDKSLLEYWQGTDMWDMAQELETRIISPEGEDRYYSNFCPEVVYEVYEIFATNLIRFSTEEEKELITSELSQGCVPWRRTWRHIDPNHYSDCQFYSLLANNPRPLTSTVKGKEPVSDEKEPATSVNPTYYISDKNGELINTINNKKYLLTPLQLPVMKVLVENFNAGNEWLLEKEILRSPISSSTRMLNAFRSRPAIIEEVLENDNHRRWRLNT